MGSGRKQRGKLADMAVRPPAEKYDPPPESACEIDDGPIEIDVDEQNGDTHIVYRHARMYRGKVVHFSLEQQLIDGDGRHVLVRVDTSHGTVHSHRFAPDGTEERREELATIPPQGHDVVDQQYYQWLDTLLQKWYDNVRRWREC